jgi:hypothetical protein
MLAAVAVALSVVAEVEVDEAADVASPRRCCIPALDGLATPVKLLALAPVWVVEEEPPAACWCFFIPALDGLVTLV